MSKIKSSSKSGKNIGILLGGNISHERRTQGLTQQELAEKIGIDSVTLSRIETGTSMPSISRLSEIADILNVSLTSLVSGISQNVSDQSQEITALLQRLSSTDRQLVVEILKQLTGRLSKK